MAGKPVKPVGNPEDYFLRPIKKSELREAARLSAVATARHWPTYTNKKKNYYYYSRVFQKVFREKTKSFIVTIHRPTGKIAAVSYFTPLETFKRHASEFVGLGLLSKNELLEIELISKKLALTTGQKTGRIGYIGGMSVSPQHEGIRLSSKHRDEREQFAARNGFTHLMTYTSPDTVENTNAKKTGTKGTDAVDAKQKGNAPANIARLERHGYRLIHESHYEARRPDGWRMRKNYYVKKLRTNKPFQRI